MENTYMEAFLSPYRQSLRASAEGLLTQALPPLTERAFARFEETGNRLEYEGSYFARRKFLTLFGMEAILQAQEGSSPEAALTQRLGNVIREVCAEETWALPAHIDRRGDPNWRHTVDLFAAETAQTLSELGDRLSPFLPPDLLSEMARQILERVLRPFFLGEAPRAWWEGAPSNWNGVCAGAIGSACLHLHRRGVPLPIPLPDCLERIERSLSEYLAGFPADGACLEGLGYYTYGMTYCLNYFQEAQALLGRRPALPEHFAAIAQFPQKCFFSDGRTVSFSDGDSRERYRLGLLTALASFAPDVQVPPFSCAAGVHTDPRYRFAPMRMDLLPVKSARDGHWREQPAERFSVLPDAQWCMGESENHVGFACKGGGNGEPHNHNDVGHFLYEAGGTVFFPDLGAGEYTADYFGENRYRILCNRSAGHSVPLLGSGEQQPGAAFRCGAFSVMAQGRVRHIRMEIGSAYADGKAKSPLPPTAAVRSFAFCLEDGTLEVEDRFDAALCGGVTERLITQIPPRLEAGRAFLTENGLTAVLERLDAGGKEGLRATAHIHRDHQGVPERVFAIEWDLPPGETGRFRIHLLACPG